MWGLPQDPLMYGEVHDVHSTPSRQPMPMWTYYGSGMPP